MLGVNRSCSYRSRSGHIGQWFCTLSAKGYRDITDQVGFADSHWEEAPTTIYLVKYLTREARTEAQKHKERLTLGYYIKKKKKSEKYLLGPYDVKIPL